MSTTMTFETLQADIRRYLERGGSLASDPTVTEQLPSLINLAEQRIATELKIQGFINVVASFMVAGQSVYQKPDRWKSTVSINVGLGAGFTQRSPVFPRSYEYVRAYWPNESETGTPEVYADYNATHWIFAGTPSEAYPFEVLYYELLPLLSDSVQSNWATDNAPRLLLYAALLETALFIKNVDGVATWQGMYDREAAMVNGEDISKIFDRAAARKEA